MGGPQVDRRQFLGAVSGFGVAAIAGCSALGGGTENGFRIEARDNVLFDDPLEIAIEGATPRSEVTLEATMPGSQDTTWESSATFLTDDEGTVDVSTQAPIEGSYSGAHPMGPVWSMRKANDVIGYFRPDAETVDLTLTATADGTETETTITRRFLRESVEVLPLDGVEGVVGGLVTPSSDGPHPGVLVLHGSEGNPMVSQAAMLASHGYAALALKWFGSESALQPQAVNVPLSYLRNAIDWLTGREDVQSGDVGLVGTSYGGVAALFVGSHTESSGPVISTVGSGLVISDLGHGGSMFTVDGEPVSVLSVQGVDDHVAAIRNADRETIEAATIPVERIDGPVLLLSAREDDVWPSTELSRFAQRRLDTSSFEHGFEHRAYAAAGHRITFPYRPTHGQKLMGGTIEGNAMADVDSWPRILSTLARGLRR